jgi:sterol 3beta-glucosyltransferase
MASSDDAGKKRVTHRIRSLSKSLHRLSTSNVPDRLKNNGDDEQEDFTAPPKVIHGRDIPYMHQSVFSLIAAAGSRSDFHSRFDDSSDSDGDEPEASKRPDALYRRLVGQMPQKGDKEPSASQSIPEESGQERRSSSRMSAAITGSSHRRQGSDNRLLRSIPSLHSRRSSKDQKSGQPAEPVTEPQGSHSVTQETRMTTPRSAPVLSRMIEAQSRFDSTTSSSEEQAEKEPDNKGSDEQKSKALLPIRLKEIFNFETPEPVIGEYPCWLMQNVALQGYMYITEGHVCFYAYLPLKSNVTVKSGQLGKRGRKNPRYKRYWFSLKGDVFSYFADPSKLYFPSGQIDLRYGISASLSDKEKGKDTRDFTVTTDHRTYYFRADSPASANEWVRALQKVIFRSQNEGGRVKISLPLEDIIDIEESPMMDLAQTFKIRVVDIYETYAIDEVCLFYTIVSNIY